MYRAIMSFFPYYFILQQVEMSVVHEKMHQTQLTIIMAITIIMIMIMPNIIKVATTPAITEPLPEVSLVKNPV